MAARAASAWSSRAIGRDHRVLAAICARSRRCSGVTPRPPIAWLAVDGGFLPALPPPQVSPLVLVEAAPDTELVSLCRVVEAVAAHPAFGADVSGLRAGVAVGREEDLRVLADAQSPAVPFAECGGDWGGHRDGKQADRPVSAGVFGHAGSLRESRDGGAVSLGLSDSLNYGKPEPGISC